MAIIYLDLQLIFKKKTSTQKWMLALAVYYEYLRFKRIAVPPESTAIERNRVPMEVSSIEPVCGFVFLRTVSSFVVLAFASGKAFTFFSSALAPGE